VLFFKKYQERIESYVHNSAYGIKAKLIIIFILIKVIPVILLSWVAWSQIVKLGDGIDRQAHDIIAITRNKVGEIGQIAVQDSVQALDLRAREEIEQLTTSTAQAVASFLYDRDGDIRLAAEQPLSEAAFQRFLSARTRKVIEHEPWIIAEDGQAWLPQSWQQDNPELIKTRVKDNETDWNYRPPNRTEKAIISPLYLEMTYVDLNGVEQLKVTTSPIMTNELRDISRRENTYTKAETYWTSLQSLKPGEIYVSEVIGPYVGSPIIGPYTPARAQALGMEFAPEQAAYAGKENPVGKKFQGIIRWAMPVEKDGRITGYVTLALNHRHLMEFTDHIIPTEKRFTPIKDASSGNYAFIWDYKGRSICHPREHSIVGYDPNTGEPAIPWLEDSIYQAWQSSGLTLRQFLAEAPTFQSPALTKKPAAELTKAGQVGLDCRYLNFAPQCAGWHELTEQGGSGSFLIRWSGLWKRTTAAAIPYYTGSYGQHRRGFGYVTIGANVEEFHRPAEKTASRINKMVDAFAEDINNSQKLTIATITTFIGNTFWNLTLMTALMIIAVILVAVWMAGFITRQLTRIIDGIHCFEQGNLQARLKILSRDELGSLSVAFNTMADKLQTTIAELKHTQAKTEEINRSLELRVKERTLKLEEALEEVKMLATVDSLTGLYNRRKFSEMLQSEFNRVERYGRSAALIILDIDFFKQVNDLHGHQAGDQVLTEFAQLLQAAARKSDILSRWGGEEFAALLPETNLQQARLVAEHLRQTIATHVFSFVGTLHVSIGVSVLRPDENVEQCMQLADQALYAAKNSGRNSVCISEDS
jgi:diguanylate cyclase (GGDEF)-like protein